MDTSTELLLMLASGASRRCGDGERPLLVEPPSGPRRPSPNSESSPSAARSPSRRCPRPRPSGAGCQHQTTAVKAGQVVDGSGVGPLALALTAVVDLAYPRGREPLPRWGAKVST